MAAHQELQADAVDQDARGCSADSVVTVQAPPGETFEPPESAEPVTTSSSYTPNSLGMSNPIILHSIWPH
jgi:hypothetical protein